MLVVLDDVYIVFTFLNRLNRNFEPCFTIYQYKSVLISIL